MTVDSLAYHRRRFESILKEAYEDGEPYFIELRYRFAVVQFRRTLSFKGSGVEITERVFTLLWQDIGEVFEDFANWALSAGFDEDEINKTVEQWLTTFQPDDGGHGDG